MKKINISQVSTFFANGSYPIEFLFYFPYHINIKKLKRALKKVSNNFWPVFGTYADGCITEETYLEEQFFDENSLVDFFDTNSIHETLHNNFIGLTPEFTNRLFYLKVLHYTNGTVLIPKMNHLVGDGYSYFYLLSVLAAITKRGGIPLVPSIISVIFKPKVTTTLDSSFHFSAKPTEAITFDSKLEVEYIEIEKDEVRNQAMRATDKAGMRISTNDILSANVVKSIVESRKNGIPENFQLAIPIDVRRGVVEFGQKFFGNALILLKVPFQPEIVSNSSIEELAITIRKSLPSVNRLIYESFLKEIDEWIENGQLELLRPYDPDNECLVTNLSRMPISRLDFGSGPPTIIIPLTKGRSGAAILSQNNKFILRMVR